MILPATDNNGILYLPDTICLAALKPLASIYEGAVKATLGLLLQVTQDSATGSVRTSPNDMAVEHDVTIPPPKSKSRQVSLLPCFVRHACALGEPINNYALQSLHRQESQEGFGRSAVPADRVLDEVCYIRKSALVVPKDTSASTTARQPAQLYAEPLTIITDLQEIVSVFVTQRKKALNQQRGRAIGLPLEDQVASAQQILLTGGLRIQQRSQIPNLAST
ncbi:hypothetical protein CPB83DRAFT_831510 [Crepidotus variabilis]|uniref:Uncharacterized protein n=1 Tax=Crepidotus variabilis TaxID=179855 RepID=A0A9P6ESI1_9AGAR|nr:hypothetical protein CPB83DRAFT_831510 [Crepidotus variabilis]